MNTATWPALGMLWASPGDAGSTMILLQTSKHQLPSYSEATPRGSVPH